MTQLFSEFKLRDQIFKNRIAVSPMCMYSSEEGLANDWHFVHLGSRAIGGAGLVFTEATAVSAEGRISPSDLGLWSEAHMAPLARVVQFIQQHGACAGIQLAHAGRKASTKRPWEGSEKVSVEQGGWIPIAPSAIAFSDKYPMPEALDHAGIQGVIKAFTEAARRSYEIGVNVVEIHAAHGYLLHQFLSPLSNQRQDQYGGSFENRMRLLMEIVESVRSVWPERLPLFVRLSATDWAPGGWDIEESIQLSRQLAAFGVDLIDVSTGGLLPKVVVPVGPGYQTHFAARIRAEAAISTGAVGCLTSAMQVEHVLRTGQADMVFLARELLRNPYWPLQAAKELGHPGTWPKQYLAVANK